MAEPRSGGWSESFDELTRGLRGSLASLQAAAETLELFPQMEESQQRRLRAVVADEARRLGLLIGRLEQVGEPGAEPGGTGRRKTSAAEIAAALAARAAAELGLAVEQEADEGGAEPASLEADPEELIPALLALLEALRREFAIAAFRLRRRRIDRHAVIDLLWQADPARLDHLREWQGEALETRLGGGDGVRPVARRHGGEAWVNVERDSSRAYLRLLLPLAG